MTAAIFLFGLGSALAAIASFLIFFTAKGAIHEIGGMVLGLTSAVFGVGSVLVFHLNRLPKRIADAIPDEQARRTPPIVGAIGLGVFLAATPAIANPMHAKLLGLPRAAQTVVLAKIAQDAGYACTGRDVEYKGTDETSGKAFWRVDCVEGRRSYLIGIEADQAGNTKVLSCDFMKSVSKKDDCFIKW